MWHEVPWHVAWHAVPRHINYTTLCADYSSFGVGLHWAGVEKCVNINKFNI